MDRNLEYARTSLRLFRRSPGLALSAVIALAMGIGFTTTMFSIVRGGTRDLPFDAPDQLVILTRTAPRQGLDLNAGAYDYLVWARQQRSFAGLAAFEQQSVNLGGDDRRPERRPATRITPNAFDLLDVRPARGRAILPEDARPGAPAVVVLGHALWQARFESDSGVVGRIIRIDGAPHTVVGVMPPRFGFPVNSALWMPLAMESEPAPAAQGTGLMVFGRMRPGVTRSQAGAELASIADRIAAEHPGTHEGHSARVYPFIQMEMATNTAAILHLMLGAVSFVLLIACANVSNLLLARAAARSRENALRTALGASRARLIAQHLAESLGLAAVGGVLGVAIAYAGVRFFAIATARIIEAFWIDFRVDWAVLLFATAMVAAAGIVAGLVPGLRASSTNVADVLKDVTGGTTGVRLGRLARGLVVAEVALATGFLIMTMTFTRTAVALRAIELPFAARQIFTGQLGLSGITLDSAESRAQRARELTLRLAAIPGVRASALASTVPGRGAGNWSFTLDAPAEPGTVSSLTTGLVMITPGFLDVLDARVLRGRGIEWSDGAGAPLVAVVNESWVRRFSPDRDPIGRRIHLGDRALEVVGVAPDLQMQDPGDRRGDGVYVSMLQMRPYAVRVMARGAGNPLSLTTAVRDAVESVDPDLPLFEIAELYDAIYADKKVLEAFGALFFVFGIGALFLTMVGVYGVVSHAVTQREREIGVRVALGASRWNVTRLVLGQGLRLVGIGTAIGLVIAFGLSHALAAATEFLQPAGALIYVALAGALLATAAAGLLRPVQRALALAPMEALRRE